MIVKDEEGCPEAPMKDFYMCPGIPKSGVIGILKRCTDHELPQRYRTQTDEDYEPVNQDMANIGSIGYQPGLR